MQIRLDGDGLVLRPWAVHDLPQLVVIFDHPEMAHRLPVATPFDRAAAEAYLAKARASRDRLYLAVTDADDLARGEVMLNLVTGGIGYAVGPPYRGERLAARALRLLTAYADSIPGLPTTYLEIEADNTGSMATARAVGYRPTGDEPVVVDEGRRRLVLHRWERGGSVTPCTRS
ncbi:GNAT family N-acetyltransferase [Verrucosispora sp. NA02020]|uniref:GNAT family N-acetyltransferase n=1 Tax=Verrucosispora sp. NA02020 TaxID=2742132 RepID=UPI00158FACFC|nr:GNAT family protein [Verrucosispora sp. NA02020]QKW12542.1 GNAT family N-acetyltransferase [Verrucosispora sp. NA02020]